MRVFLTNPLPTSLGGRTVVAIADHLFASGHEVVVITPSPRLKMDKPYPVHSGLFAPDSHRPDGFILNQAWAFTVSSLIFGDPDVVLHSHAGTWNDVTSAFPTAFFNPSGKLESAGRVTSISWGLDPKLFDTTIESSRESLLSRYAQELHGIDKNTFWIVGMTDVVHPDGIETLIRAAQGYEIDSSRPVATLVIGLDDADLEHYHRMTYRLATEGVRFINHLADPADAARFLNEADLVALSNREIAGSMEDVVAIATPDAQSSAAAIRRALKMAEHDTDMNATLRAEMLTYLNYEHRKTLGRLDIAEPMCSAQCREKSAGYRHFAARQIAVEGIADGVSIRVNASIEGARVNHTKSFNALTRSFGWDAVGKRVAEYLIKAARHTPRMRGVYPKLSLDIPLANRIHFDEDVMEAFERLEKTRGTGQFGQAFRAFDRTVNEYFGTRAELAHSRGESAEVFAGVAQACGIPTTRLMNVMEEFGRVPKNILMGVEYQKPPERPDATIIRVPFGKPR